MLWEHGQKLESNKTMTNLFLYFRNIFTEIWYIYILQPIMCCCCFCPKTNPTSSRNSYQRWFLLHQSSHHHPPHEPYTVQSLTTYWLSYILCYRFVPFDLRTNGASEKVPNCCKMTLMQIAKKKAFDTCMCLLANQLYWHEINFLSFACL